MNSIIVLQARTGSSRLPAKVLLPIAGIPLVALAAQRAANTGRKVLIATSTEPQDDELTNILDHFDLPYFRGDLQNTLGRIVRAIEKYTGDTILIRLTADNVFPDGTLIDAVIADFQKRGLDYLACNGEASGLPYGTSVEVTLVKHLRQADAEARTHHDREHVTPHIIHLFGYNAFTKHQSLKKGHLRCTIDLYEDYLEVCRVFRNVQDPINVSCLELIDRLQSSSSQPLAGSLVPQLIFGAAQLGMGYGITNTTGIPDPQEAETLLKTAISNGVQYIDTAQTYGNSEAIIGKSLSHGWHDRVNIITKLSPLDDIPADANSTLVHARVDQHIFDSCRKLRTNALDVLMLHRAAHITAWQDSVWHRLLLHQKNGIVKELGISVQTPSELAQALEIEALTFIQMPFNVLDHRWDQLIEVIRTRKRHSQLTLHVRSSLLQGLLTSRDPQLWANAHIAAPENIITWLENYRTAFACKNIVELCLRYIRSLDWVDGIVVGMESRPQLHANIHHFNTPALTATQQQTMLKNRPIVHSASLDPAQWRKI